MKLKLALAVGFLAGAAAVVVAVVSFNNKGPLPTTPEVSAAEPGKPDEPAKGADYNYQYERTKPRAVVGGRSRKFSGTVDGKFVQEVAAESELRCFAARVRKPGQETYLVGLSDQYVKIEGGGTMPDPTEYHMTADDAAAGVRFIERMKAAKKSSEIVDTARIDWWAELRTWEGEPYRITNRLTATYSGDVKFTADSILNSGFGFHMSVDEFAKVLAEGLKDVDALKKAEWSPVP
jgi:hypothetical protein